MVLSRSRFSRLSLCAAGLVGVLLPLSARAQDPLPALRIAIEVAVERSAQRWFVNRLDVGSVSDVAIVAAPDADTRLVRASYRFNGGQAGAVMVRVRGGAIDCLQFWDKPACEPVSPPIMALAGSARPARPAASPARPPAGRAPKATDREDREAYLGAVEAWTQHDFSRAWALSAIGTEHAYPPVLLLVAHMAENGEGMDANPALAMRFYRQALATGDPSVEHTYRLQHPHGPELSPAPPPRLAHNAPSGRTRYAPAYRGAAPAYAPDASDVAGFGKGLAEAMNPSEPTPSEDADNLNDSDVEARVRERMNDGADDEATEALRQRDQREEQMQEQNEPEPSYNEGGGFESGSGDGE